MMFMTSNMKSNERTFFIRNKQELSWKATPQGFDVTINGRWKGRDTQIFISLAYEPNSHQLGLFATKDSYMMGFKSSEKDFGDSPVKGLRAYQIGSAGQETWHIYSEKCHYTRAQRKLVPDLMIQVLEYLPVSKSEQEMIKRLHEGYREASWALQARVESERNKAEYFERMTLAKEMLKMDEVGVETLVALVSEGGDLCVLAKNMEALLR